MSRCHTAQLPSKNRIHVSYRDAVALSDVGAEYAGHHTAEVQQWHAGAPAIVAGRLALHAGEAEKTAAAWRAEENQGSNLTLLRCDLKLCADKVLIHLHT